MKCKWMVGIFAECRLYNFGKENLARLSKRGLIQIKSGYSIQQMHTRFIVYLNVVTIMWDNAP